MACESTSGKILLGKCCQSPAASEGAYVVTIRLIYDGITDRANNRPAEAVVASDLQLIRDFIIAADWPTSHASPPINKTHRVYNLTKNWAAPATTLAELESLVPGDSACLTNADSGVAAVGIRANTSFTLNGPRFALHASKSRLILDPSDAVCWNEHSSERAPANLNLDIPDPCSVNSEDLYQFDEPPIDSFNSTGVEIAVNPPAINPDWANDLATFPSSFPPFGNPDAAWGEDNVRFVSSKTGCNPAP